MRFSFILILASFLATQSLSQGIEFFHGTWNEALEEAKKQGKPIFVDAYAKWCGPCKRMAANTFPNPEVGEYFNKNFINLKIDAEEGDGISFRKKYPVSAFPTLFFIDEKGEVIHTVTGAHDVPGLLKLGEFALGKVDYSRDYAVEYEKGNREPELVYNYVKALNKSGKSSLKIANEYVRTQKDLTTEFNLRFIHEAAVEADSRLFDLLVKHQKEIGILVGLDGLRERIKLACKNTAKKAVEFQNPELLSEAKAKMKQHYPEQAEAFAAEADLSFYRAAKDAANYAKACDEYVKKVAKGEPKSLHKLADETAALFGSDEKCMKMAEKYARDAAEKGNSTEYYLTYATILYKNGKKKDAISAANKSLELAKTAGNNNAERLAQMLIQKMEG